jgi:hypothetical protein
MKKKILLLACLCTLSNIFAQGIKKESREKIKALKAAYITDQLDLTADEAEKFWPIYNDYEQKKSALLYKTRSQMRNAIKKNGEIDALSEKEAKKLISSKLDSDKKLYELQNNFLLKVKKIISYKKIIKLQISEIDFTRKLMKRYKRKRESNINN